MRLLGAVVVLMVVAGSVSAVGQQRRIPFSVVVRALESEIKSGSDVIVEITITNTSDAAIGLEGMEISPYVAIVREASGLLAPETELGRKLKQKQRERMDSGLVGSRFGWVATR